jgi:hypothetical protein
MVETEMKEGGENKKDTPGKTPGKQDAIAKKKVRSVNARLP